MMRLVDCAIVTVLVVCLGAGALGATVVDALVATVGSRVIMLSDVRLARHLRNSRQESDEATLAELVNRSLMLIEVERFQQVEPAAAAVDSAMEELRRRIDPAAWADMLRRCGVDEAYVRAYVRDDLRVQTYLLQRFGALSEPSDEDLVAAIEQRRRSASPESPPSAEALRAAARRELGATRFAGLVDQWATELRARGDVSIRGIPAGAWSDASRE